MRITFLVPTLNQLAGGLRVIAQHALYLHEQGHSVTLVTRLQPQPTLKQRLKALVKKPSTNVIPFEQGYFSDMPMDIRILPYALGRLAPEDVPDADVIIGTWWETVEWLDGLPPEKGRPVHFLQDHENFPILPQDRVKRVHELPIHKIAVAKWLAEVVETTYGTPADIAMNGVNIADFPFQKRRKNSPIKVGVLYSSVPRKNIKLALDAIVQAKSVIPDLECIAFGAHALAHDLPEGMAFIQKPPQSEIPKIYGQCDVWLFPTEVEGFGLPLLEAMSCGTPILATSAGAAPDLIGEKTGRILPPNPEAFAQAIIDMSHMPAQDWEQMSQACRATAAQNTVEKSSERFAELLLKGPYEAHARTT